MLDKSLLIKPHGTGDTNLSAFGERQAFDVFRNKPRQHSLGISLKIKRNFSAEAAHITSVMVGDVSQEKFRTNVLLINNSRIIK